MHLLPPLLYAFLRIIVKYFLLNYRVHQLPGDIVAGKSHDTYLRRPEAEEVDTAIPYCLSVYHRKLLMEAGFLLYLYPVRFQSFRVFSHSFPILLWKILRWACNNNYFCLIQHFHPDSITQKWERFIAKHNLIQIRLHDLRHSNATALIAAGVSAKVVQHRLGHANVSITLNTYTHVLPSMDEEAAEKLDHALFSSAQSLSHPPMIY